MQNYNELEKNKLLKNKKTQARALIIVAVKNIIFSL
jgi:hypothetical protein